MKDDEELILTPNLIHYGKIVKKGTGKFVRWAKDPNVLSYADRCSLAVSKAVEVAPFLNIVKSISEQYEEKGSISPKQLDTLNEIISRYKGE